MTSSGCALPQGVRRTLEGLLAALREVLGERLVGFYVHGSVASGGYVPGRSDIDFVVVTEGELSPELLPTLEGMHRRIRAGGWEGAEVLEGSYIPRGALRRYDPAEARHPALRMDGSFDVDFHGSDWVIQRHVLRETGLALAGPPLDELIDRVGPEALRAAAAGALREWWAPMLEDHSRLRGAEYQAFAVLTMARALYTLRFGEVVSKERAARWAQDEGAAGWVGLIEEALAWRRGVPMDRLEEVLALMRYTLERAEISPLRSR